MTSFVAPLALTQRRLCNKSVRRTNFGVKHKIFAHPHVRHNRNTRKSLEVRNALGFGFLTPRPPEATNASLLPSPEARCACASTKPYGKCCRRFHTAQIVPQQAEDLLRSRYSAYAYRLPSYIMKTTHSSAIELDRRMWKREIMGFCKEYQFVGGIDIIEMQMPAPYTTRILFRYVTLSFFLTL